MWNYTDGYRIVRWGAGYAVVTDNAIAFQGSLGACNEWLQSRNHWPVVKSGR